MTQRAESLSVPHNKRKLIHFSLPSGRAKSNGFVSTTNQGRENSKAIQRLVVLLRVNDSLDAYTSRISLQYLSHKLGYMADIDAKEMAWNASNSRTVTHKMSIGKTLFLWIIDFGRKAFF